MTMLVPFVTSKGQLVCAKQIVNRNQGATMYTGVHPILRSLHTWIGLLILIPVIFVSATAILLAHDKDLGLPELTVQNSWLPDAWVQPPATPVITAYLAGAGGAALIGTDAGLYQLSQGNLTVMAGMESMDIRAMRRWEGQVFVAAKQGIYLSAHNKWYQLYDGDAQDVDVDENGTLYVTTPQNSLWISGDGGENWQESPTVPARLSAMTVESPDQGIALKTLIRNLHTGRLVVGESDEWIWIDSISGLLLFISLIGAFRWWKKRNVY